MPARPSSAPPVPRRRTAWVCALALAGALLAGCSDDGDGVATDPATTPGSGSPTPSASPTGGTSPTPSPTETPDRSPADASLVYFPVDTRAGLRLAREPREVSGLPGVGAVEAMIAGPEDPDYGSTWNPDTRVLGVAEQDGVLTVDLSEEARTANVGSPGAALMVQQLVWTVTEPFGTELGVRLLIEGEPAGELWGAVTWDEPIGREAGDDVRAFVGIDLPVEGSVVSSPVTVTGEAIAFEATVPWRVLDQQGDEVRSGFATAEEGMTLAPYTFRVRLEPGTWTLEVTEDDPSGGEGGEPFTDSRTITVE